MLGIIRSAAASPPSAEIESSAVFPFQPWWREKGDCGILSLFLLMRLNDQSVTVDQIKKSMSGKFLADGCTLADLTQVAGFHDFSTEVRFIKPVNLREIDFPCILHTTGSIEKNIGHFIVLVGYNSDKRQFATISTDLEDLLWFNENTILDSMSGYIITHQSRFDRMLSLVSRILIYLGVFSLFIILLRWLAHPPIQ